MARKKGTEEGRDIVEEIEPETDANGNIESPVRSLEVAATEVWTASEMEEAQPIDLIEVSEQDVEEADKEIEEELVGGGSDSGVQAGGTPEVEEEGTGEELLAGYGYPPPFTRHNVIPPYSLYPYRTVGKLFFRNGGKSYVCSASSIGNYAIWTAGHCVHAGNGMASGWSTNVVFVPAYKNGTAPYGQWPAKNLWTRTAWYKNGIPKGLCQDMGGAVLYPKSGKKISQVVGWLGFAWDWSRVQHWHSLDIRLLLPSAVS